MSMEMNKALDLLREIRPSIPKEVLELWCKDRDAFLASHPAVEQAGANVGHGHVFPRADGVKMRCGGPGLCSECAADAYRARAALAQPSPAQTQPSPAPTLRAAIDVANDRFEVPVAKWGTDLVGEEERPEVAEVAFVLRNIGAMDAEDIDGDNVDLRFEDAEGRDTGCDVSIVEYAEKAADLLEQQDRIVGELRADRDSWAEQAEQRLADWDEMRKERDAALARVAELEGKLTDWVHEGFRLNQALAMASDAASKGDAARQAAGGMEMEIQELKAKLAEMEKQEPVDVPGPDEIHQMAFEEGQPAEDGDGYLFSAEEFDLFVQRLLDSCSTPVARAQHSVPEEFSFEYRHPNGESHTVTVSRDQVINEMPDFLFEALCSKFCNCEPVGETNVVECCCDEYAEEFKLLAAAPGKEGA
ncbi:hypothetical protein [Pseudomonas aeruginosa]|uniref:hypothetical protein n=1 Tax=Pseudomonas aeruginosa TaxID=287 RepID=UPI001BD4FD6D|nr:hypothetical protein [Pseudomonas aeruginosa]MBS9730160.1 hypothetical protein [Pseudomonas aeruginosa]